MSSNNNTLFSKSMHEINGNKKTKNIIFSIKREVLFFIYHKKSY